jgi:tape measure domain-containing protein
MLLSQLVVEYVADLTDLETGTQRALGIVNNFGKQATGPATLGQSFTQAAQNVADFSSKASSANSQSSALASAQAKAAVAARNVEVAEANAALALKKATDLQASGTASAEQIAVAQAKAALAADKVQVAEANASIAMQKVDTTAQHMASAVQEDAEQIQNLAHSAEQAHSPLQGLGSRIGGVVSGLLDFGSRVGMTIFGFQQLWQGAQQLGQALLEPNAAMEQSRVSFLAFLNDGKKVDGFLHQLSDFAATTPFEFDDAKQGALNLLNMGVASQDVTRYLNNIGDAVAKVGGSGQIFQDVTGIIEQMGVKGKVTTEDMLQLTNRNIPAFQILADAMHVPVSTLQDMISKGQLGKDKIDLLVASMGKFGNGAMVAQGQTFNGLLSTLKDNAEAALRTFTGPLFEQAKNDLKQLGDFVSSKQFQDFAAGAGKALGEVVQDISKLGSMVQQASKSEGFQHMVSSFEKLGSAVSTTLGPLLQPVINGLKGLFSDKSVADGANKLAGAFDSIGTAIDGLNGGIKTVNDLFKQAQPTFQQIGDFLTNNFKPVWGQLVDTWQNQLVPAWNDFMATLGPAMPTLAEIGQLLLMLAVPSLVIFFGTLGLALKGLILIFGLMVGATMGLVNIFLWLLAQTKPVWDQIVAGFQWLYDELVGHSIIPDLINKITGFFTGLPGQAVKWMTDFGNSIVNTIRGFINKVGQAASDVAGAISSHLHFSLPDTGPLADSDKWMPDFGDMLTQGLNAQVGKVRLASLNVAASIASPSTSPLQGRASAAVTSSSSSGNGGEQYITIYLDSSVLATAVGNKMMKQVRVRTGAKV